VQGFGVAPYHTGHCPWSGSGGCFFGPHRYSRKAVQLIAQSIEAREIRIISKSRRQGWSYSSEAPAVAVSRTDETPYDLSLNDVDLIKSRVSPDVHVYAYEDFHQHLSVKENLPDDGARSASTPAGSGDPGAGRAPWRQVNVVASTEDVFPAYNAEFREGIGFSASDVASGNRCMVLGSRLAQRLFGDSSALGKRYLA